MTSTRKLYWGKSIGSFILVLFLMPLGHALMILMEHFLEATALHVSAFIMGLVGFIVTIYGVFVKGDTKQTLFGLIGGLLFWTGWVEFLMAYYAQRYGTHCDLTGTGTVTTISHYVDGVVTSHEFLINGTPLEQYSRAALKAIRGSRPEYLTMPSSFGFFMMFAMIYILNIKTGCNAINWCQRVLFGHRRDIIEVKPMARHASIVTFMELNTMMWALYLVLMFCYDPVFLGDSHPVTFFVAFGCLIGSGFMFKRQLHLSGWGANIRMTIATVIVFWTFVEVIARNQIFTEIWVAPLEHQKEMYTILGVFVLLAAFLFVQNVRHRK